MASVMATPAAATRGGDQSAVFDYVRARAADARGSLAEAARGYGQALAARPDDPVIALRAYRQGLAAGDFAVAIRAATALDKAGALPADGMLLLAAKAIRDKDWTAADAAITRVDKDAGFNFLAPVLTAWARQGSGRDDALAALDGPFASSLTNAYAAEHRALMLFALGRADDAVTAVQALGATGDPRMTGLRIAAAARLVTLDRRETALSVLRGDDPLIRAARARVEAGKPLSGGITTPAQAASELFARLAADIGREKSSPIVLALSRIAEYLDPTSAAARFTSARALAAGGYDGDAAALLDRIGADSPYGGVAADARVTLLLGQGEEQRALAIATAAAAAPGARLPDLARLGDIHARLKQYREASAAYDRAIAFAERSGDEDKDALWTLWLLKGGALEQGGDWQAALPALKKAAELAPDQPAVLNYLGYAQLERGENVKQAAAMVARASALRPDDPSITDSLGWAYYMNGDTARAIETLERAVVGEPADPTINEHLGDAYWRAGRRYEARYAWRAASVQAEGATLQRLTEKLADGLAATAAR